MSAIMISLGLCCLALIALVKSFELMGDGYKPTARQRRQWGAWRRVARRHNRRVS